MSMIQEQLPGSTIQPRAYHRKTMRWYYSSIIDWMMANPGKPLSDCAAYVGKTQPTLSAIIRSDMFQAALAQRKAQFSAQQDLVITQKMTQVTVATLDTILNVLEKKKDTIPLETLERVANTTLSRLGYGIEKAAPTAVQVNVHQNAQVQAPISAVELEEARKLMRQHQQQIANASPVSRLDAPLGAASPIEGEILPPLKEAALVNGSEEG